jgi:hypothetical protein
MNYIYNMYQQNEQILNTNFENPQKYVEKVITLQQQMRHILDDFIKYFILYNKDPTYPEYQTMFENIKSNLNSLSSSLFMVSNDIDVNIDNINKLYASLDVLIKKERKKNRELKRKLGIIESKTNSSNEMIDDYSEIYDIDYLRNWALFLSIIMSGIVISVVFKKQNI